MTLAAPMFGIVTSEFRHPRTVAVNKSPFNAKTYRSSQQDWAWTASFTYAPMRREVAAPLLALISAQGEGAGSFLAFDPDYPLPLSGYLGTGTVGAAGQAGTTLATTGWLHDCLIARADDRVFVPFTAGAGTAYQMFVVLADVVADASGNASFTLHAPLRGSPVSGGLVGMTPSLIPTLRIPMRLTGYAKPCDVAGFFRITLTAEEIV